MTDVLQMLTAFIIMAMSFALMMAVSTVNTHRHDDGGSKYL
jgi:hypothetical protein